MTWKVYKSESVSYIVLTGPQPEQDRYGDEQPVWYLIRYDSDDNEITHTTYYYYDDLIKMGEALAKSLGVPLENQAMRA